MQKLQCVQNVEAKLVLNSTGSSLSCLKQKVFTLLFQSLRGESPQYLRDLVELHTSGHEGLRSNTIYVKLKGGVK